MLLHSVLGAIVDVSLSTIIATVDTVGSKSIVGISIAAGTISIANFPNVDNRLGTVLFALRHQKKDDLSHHTKIWASW